MTPVSHGFTAAAAPSEPAASGARPTETSVETPGAQAQARTPTLPDTIGFCMGNRVSLFVTCIVDQLFPKVGMAMAGVLEGLGYRVDFSEDQTWCGPPAFNSGY